MKKVILFCCVFLMIMGCKKSDPRFDNYFRMKIDGVPYSVGFTIKTSSPANTPFDINAESQNVTLYIQIPDPKLGITLINDLLNSPKFSLVDYDNQQQYYAGDGGLLGAQEGKGQINILEIAGDHVKGTFEFTTAQEPVTGTTKVVTEGAFNLQKGL